MTELRRFMRKTAHRMGLLVKTLNVWHIARSGLFDSDYYLSAYPGVAAFWQRVPMVHYALIGERIGYAPNGVFEPMSYARMYEDVPGYAPGPFVHYIRHGQRERRETRSPLTAHPYYDHELPTVEHWAQTARYAIVVHVYYPDLWDEIRAQLASVNIPYDLIVTVPEGPAAQSVLDRLAESDVPITKVFKLPNIGRDVLAFLHLVNSDMLSGYDAVCKLHTKKSAHLVDGDLWRRELVECLLPSNHTCALLTAFMKDPTALVLVPDRYRFQGDKWWSINRPVAEKLIAHTDLSIDDGMLEFAAGSMYWCKSNFIRAVKDLNLSSHDFVVESGQLDGTTAHAFERLTGYLATSASGRIAIISDLSDTSPFAIAAKKSDFKMIPRASV